VARELEITLTSRPVSKGERVPLAGIPHHALDPYLAKLIAKGYRVAICEQTTEPEKGRKIVDREVVRVVTPGTVIEERLLDDKSHNYIAAVARQGGVWGLARCDLSTGALAATEPTGPDPRAALFDEISRVAPAELIATAEDMAPIEKEIAGRPGAPALQRIDPGLTRLAAARSALLEQFGVQNLEGFGAEETPAALCAAGALVAYLRETQRRAPGHVHRLEIYRSADHLILDAVTRRSLELTRNLIDGSTRATLLDVLDCTRTPMGGRLLRDWLLQPLQERSTNGRTPSPRSSRPPRCANAWAKGCAASATSSASWGASIAARPTRAT
jgi:DNA mismatch repair protein MutS